MDAHLRRMRPIYRRRRDGCWARCGVVLPGLEPVGAAAGLHVLAYLPDGMDDVALVGRAAEAGIALGALTPRRVAPGRGGLIFGYGSIDEGRIEAGIERLAGLIEG